MAKSPVPAKPVINESPFDDDMFVDTLESVPVSEAATSDFYKGHRPTPVQDWGPSLTRQEFVAECDINTIMERYEATGVFPPTPAGDPLYYDFASVPDNLQDSLTVMNTAQEAFMQLPAKIRREFDNNPQHFAEFAMDPQNLGQMQAWGLAKPPKDVHPLANPVVPDPKAPPPPAAPQAASTPPASPAT